MSTPIPPPLRAAAGLAALAIDNARKAPQRLVGLPVLAVSAALQASLKAQQTYAGLVARGDEVLGQLRGHQDAPAWARFDEDDAEPAGFPARSAFDAAPEPPLVEDPTLIDEVDRDLDPDTEADVVSLADAEDILAEQADAEQADDEQADDEQAEADDENVLGETEEDEVAAADAALGEAGVEVAPFDAEHGDRRNGRTPSTEPGADLPAEGTALAADAAATGAALAADSPLDGYLAVDPPVAGYDGFSIPQLRGRLRALSVEQVEALLGYERANQARPPYLTMLENRLTTLRSR
ncbi:MAG TPA: lipid droplet-associated protein [Mycobacteriales bacterium]|nr:lipid droplet-associated protein [Mycobacteriales bacterium]